MSATYVFIIAFVLLLVVFIRRLQVTRKDITLQQEFLQKQAEENKEEPEQPDEEKSFKEKLHRELAAKDDNKTAEINRLFRKADTLFSQGDYKEAQKLFIQIIALDPKHLEANNKLGLIYLKQNENIKAELIYKNLISIKQDAIYYSNLGLALFNQKKLEESALAYEKSISLDRRRPARFISLAHVYNELQKPEKALSNFEEASKLEPKNTELLFIIADYYRKKDNLQKVRVLLEKILTLEPYNEEAKKGLEEMGVPKGN